MNMSNHEQPREPEHDQEQVQPTPPFEHAAVNLPASDSPSSATPVYEPTSPFWQEPPERSLYFPPPYSVGRQLELLCKQVEMIADYLQSRGFEAKRQELIFRLYTDVLPASEEFERLRNELEPQRAQLEKAIQQTQAELMQVEQEVYKKLAEARLPIPTSSRAGRRAQQPPRPPAVEPEMVEKALSDAFANPEDICGEQGIAPPRERGGFLSQFAPVGTFFLELLAPLTAGILLGINLGVITGFLSLSDLLNLKKPLLFGFAVLVGFFVEKMGGIVYYALTSSFAQASEKREVGNEVQPIPSLRHGFLFGFLTLLALALGVGMVTVDALGLRMLHEEAIRNAQVLGAQAGEVLPLWVYFIAGVIISMPYLIYKAVRGWRDTEIRQREARVEYLRWQHVEQRRAEPAVQQAFTLAKRAVELRQQILNLQQEHAFLTQRLDSARTQAIGCHVQFRDYLQQLLNQMDGVYPTNGRHAPRQQETETTLLKRLLEFFSGKR